MIPHPCVTLERILEAVQADDNIGFCLHCGEEIECVEPDARNYTCPSCGAAEVFGAEELLIQFTWLSD